MGISKRRRLCWAIAIAMTSGSAAWAADDSAPPAAPAAIAAHLAGSAEYKLECPRILALVDLRLRGRWLVDTRASLGGETFYSLEQQVSYFVAHEPSLVVKLPEALAHAAPSRIELATLELYLF